MSTTPGQVTSAEVLKGTKLKSGKTLTRWYQMGLIPAPVVRTHPSGRGRTGYFDERVVPQINRIRELGARGYGLRAAAAEVDRQDLERAVTEAILERLIPPDSAAGQAFIAQLRGTSYESP